MNLTTEGDLDWGVFANSTLSPSNRMSGGAGYNGMTYLGGAVDAFYHFYAQNTYSWINGQSPSAGSESLTTNANLTSDGDGLRMTFTLVSAGTYRLKFYASTSATNLRATASLRTGGVSDFASGTVPEGLEKYEFIIDFTTYGGDTLTLDVVKDGGQAILAYEAFSLSAVSVTPVPNLNIDSSFSFTNASVFETFQIPYANNGSLPLNISSVTLGGSDAGYFTLNSFSSSLGVGANGSIFLGFNPSAGDRVYNATLTIASNDSDSPSTIANLSVNSGNVSQIVDIFILAGQSNANGQGLVNTLTPQQAGPHNAKFFVSWHYTAWEAETDQYFSGWMDQTVAGETRSTFHRSSTLGAGPWFGPEIGFVARANEINLTSNQMAVIKYTVDGSSINTTTDQFGESDWDLAAVGYREGDCWRGFQAALANAVSALQDDGYTPNFKGLIWWQGENGTNANSLNLFIAEVRNLLGSTYGLQDASEFPVVITSNNVWGFGLESGVAAVDDYVGAVDSYAYGQNVVVHVGSNEGPFDVGGNGINDMFDIGVAYADKMATLVESSGEPVAIYTITFINVDGSQTIRTVNAGAVALPPDGVDTATQIFTGWPTVTPASANATYLAQYTVNPVGGNFVDVFIATGQSNAYWPVNRVGEQVFGTYQFGYGVQDTLVASGLFSNPVVVIDGQPGQHIASWFYNAQPQWLYQKQFFGTYENATAGLEATINDIIANGDTPRFRGIFWFQGESDGEAAGQSNTSETDYRTRWNGLLGQLASDLGSSDFNFVMNTVGNSGTRINNTLTAITNADARGVLFDTQTAPYRSNFNDIHGYDHYAVGQANAQLFMDTFLEDSSQPETPQSADVTWDGSAGDGEWTSSANWSGDAVPVDGNTITINNGDTVNMPSNDWTLPESIVVTVSGNSHIGNTYAAARLYGGMTFNFASGSGMSGAYIDLYNGILNFEAGSTFTPINIQHRGTTTYGITFSNAGFATLTPGALHSGTDEGWSNVTFNIDVSDYDVANGATVELIDYASHGPAYGGDFNPNVTLLAGDSGLTGSLAFDSADSKVVFNFDSVTAPTTYTITFINVDGTETYQTVNAGDFAVPPVGVDTADKTFTAWPTIVAATADVTYSALYDLNASTADVIWDGDANDGLWTSAANWNTNTVPTVVDSVLVGSSATVTEASINFASLQILSGASVTLDAEGQYLNTKTVEIDGTLNISGTFRPIGCTLNLSGSLGADISWLDMRSGSTLNFSDGASLANTSMNLELRDTPTLGFTLSTTGFTAVAAGQLYDATAGAGWSAVTFTIDVSNYEPEYGRTIILMDFSSHVSGFSGTFNPVVNIISGSSGNGGALRFDTATSQLILEIDPPGNDAPVASDRSYAVNGTDPVAITLSASDGENDTLTYSVLSDPGAGILTGIAPDLTYTYTGSNFEPDSFTYRANDGQEDSNIATVTIVPVPQNVTDLWGSLQSKIETDPLNVGTHTTWTEAHSDGSGATITISRVTYELGTLTGTQHTATPIIAAYYARPTGGTNLPGVIQNHGGGQNADSNYAKLLAEMGYAAMCINWGALHLENRNPNEPDSPAGQLYPNTDWDGLAGGFTRENTAEYPLENPVTDAIFYASIDPKVFNDGQTLYDISHPLNSSWALNGYAVRRAITYLQSLPEVDDSKIGVLGWSMGGRTTMMASTDPRITVLAPGVGGTGYVHEDFWGLPGTARHWRDPQQNIELFKRTVADQGYWPYVSAPVLFLNASNDFNAPFDLATKSLSIHEVGLDEVSPVNILVTDPHFNHRLTDEALATRMLWMRHFLHGDVEFPGISDSVLDMTPADGVPIFKVYPDDSTDYTIQSVQIFYGTDRDSRTRFWREAEAMDRGDYWEAQLPIFDVEDMMVAHAVITYDIGFTQSVPYGSPTNLIKTASKVHTYYPQGVDPAYSLPADLDSAVHQIHSLDPSALVDNGLRETAEISFSIDDPSGTRGFTDWFLINGNNSNVWQFYTRKLSHPSYRGGEGAALTFDLTATAANTLQIKIVVDEWNENSETTYHAAVPINAGLNKVSLTLADFKRVDNTVLSAWSRAKYIGFGSGRAFNLNSIEWSGSLPVLADMAWSGGEHILEGGISSTWLSTYGLPLSNDTILKDTDGDGQTAGAEYFSGTDPTDSTSVFRVESTAMEAGNFILNWQAVAGKSYAIDFSEDLENPSWSEVASGISGVEPITQHEHTLGTESKGFFQVRLE